jgi:hypothetical protein
MKLKGKQLEIAQQALELNKSRQKLTEEFKPLTLVAFNWAGCDLDNPYIEHPSFCFDAFLLFLGQIPSVPNQCVIADREGNLYWPVRMADFVVIGPDDPMRQHIPCL